MLNEAGHPRIKSTAHDLMFDQRCADPGSRDRLQRILVNMGMMDEQRAPLAMVGGDEPIFHDAAMDEALNDYVEKFVDYLEEDVGESRATLALLETLKGFLVDALNQATLDAKMDAGVRD